MKQKEFYGVDLKTWLKLVFASAVSAVLVLPYSLKLAGQAIPPLSEFPKIAALAFIQNAIIFLLVAYLGLRISKKIGIEPTPVLSGKVRLKKYLRFSIVSGIAVGLAIVLSDFLFDLIFTIPVRAGVGPEAGAPGPVEGFLGSVYGGIAEEVLMRLFIVPLFCLLIIAAMRLLGFAKTWKQTSKVVWASVILTAILFGLAHLPITSAVVDITPVVVLRAVLLNGIGGVVFGWLFYRKGLEFAMISHFSTDIVLHVLLPLLGYTL